MTEKTDRTAGMHGMAADSLAALWAHDILLASALAAAMQRAC